MSRGAFLTGFCVCDLSSSSVFGNNSNTWIWPGFSNSLAVTSRVVFELIVPSDF